MLIQFTRTSLSQNYAIGVAADLRAANSAGDVACRRPEVGGHLLLSAISLRESQV